MDNIHIVDSYKIWNVKEMRKQIDLHIPNKNINAKKELNRTYISMYIEWWLHNIGYYISKIFIEYDFWKNINDRCKDVDLDKWDCPIMK